MPRLVRVLLFACAASLLLPLQSVPVVAQQASPVALESDPAPLSDEAEFDASTDQVVVAAESAGNTPITTGSTVLVPLTPNIHVYFHTVTTAGHTTATELPPDAAPPLPAGYRASTARLFSIETTSTWQPNAVVCVIVEPGWFAGNGPFDLLRSDGSDWFVITAPYDGNVCGYTPAFGIFAIAESGTDETPTAIPSDTPTPAPSDTPTATPTTIPSETASATATETVTIPPTATETETATATATETETATATSTPTETDTATATATETASATATETATATPSQTASPTPMPTETPTPTETATAVPTTTPTATETPSPSPSPAPTDTPTASPTDTPVPPTSTGTPIETPTPTSTSVPSQTPTTPPTTTPPPTRTQFALPNVYVTFSALPLAGETTGSVHDGSGWPAIPVGYLASTAWYFTISTTVVDINRKEICVMLGPIDFQHPADAAILQRSGSTWLPLLSQAVSSDTVCGVTPGQALSDFVVVARTPATSTATVTPTRTVSPTVAPSSTATPTSTPTASSTASATPTASPTLSPSSTSTVSPSPTPTVPSATATATPSPTSTRSPGSYPTGSVLRSTTRVNLRSGPSTSATTLGVVDSGSTVTVTGPSVTAEGRIWIPVSATGLGAGWVAGSYFAPVPAPTPTRTPVLSSPTGTAAAATPSRTPTRPPGGFTTGDTVQTTASLNLRSGPSTSATVLAVLPIRTAGTVTGPPATNGGVTFYPVRFDGYPAGYVSGSYLQRIGALPTPTRTPSPSPTVAGNPLRWTTSNANLRSGPGTGYRILETLPKDTRVTLTGAPRRSGGYDWYPVIVDGRTSGWIAGSLLTPIPPL